MNTILSLDDIVDDEGDLIESFTTLSQEDSSSRKIPHGCYLVYDGDRLWAELVYNQGTLDGLFIDYWSNGQVAGEGRYVCGLRHGVWHFYNKDGTLFDILVFEHGKEIRNNSSV